jgi:hypothetical protein
VTPGSSDNSETKRPRRMDVIEDANAGIEDLGLEAETG